MNPDNPNFRTPEEEARAAELVRLKAEVERLSRPVSAVCTKCGYDKPANLYEQTIARQAEVIEKLKAMLNRFSPFEDLKTVNQELEAIEQGEGT